MTVNKIIISETLEFAEKSGKEFTLSDFIINFNTYFLSKRCLIIDLLVKFKIFGLFKLTPFLGCIFSVQDSG